LAPLQAKYEPQSLWDSIHTHNIAVALHARNSPDFIVRSPRLFRWLARWFDYFLRAYAHELMHLILYALQDQGFYPFETQHHHPDRCTCQRVGNTNKDGGNWKHSLVTPAQTLEYVRNGSITLDADWATAQLAIKQDQEIPPQ
jgi:hypothetical protein